MIRTLLVITAFAAVAGAANAADYHLSLVGKDDAAIRAEVGHAARLVCHEVALADYAPCVTDTYNVAMGQVSKIKASGK